MQKNNKKGLFDGVMEASSIDIASFEQSKDKLYNNIILVRESEVAGPDIERVSVGSDVRYLFKSH